MATLNVYKSECKGIRL